MRIVLSPPFFSFLSEKKKIQRVCKGARRLETAEKDRCGSMDSNGRVGGGQKTGDTVKEKMEGIETGRRSRSIRGYNKRTGPLTRRGKGRLGNESACAVVRKGERGER
jgi:hypothetical protein